MAHVRFLRLSLFFIALWLTNVSSIPAYGQRVWSLVSSDFKGGSLQFPTADTGYAVVIGGVLHTTSVIRTTDGGQSWNPVDLPLTSFWGYQYTNLTFCGSLGWLVTTAVDSTGYPIVTKLLGTMDYGFTWSMIPIDSSSWFNTGIYFKSPSLGYLWGDDRFDISTDSGRTWQPRTVPPGIGGGSVQLIGEPNVVLGLGNGGCEFCSAPFLSTDTGATWSVYDSSLHLAGLPYMAYIGSGTWIGSNGWSTDNGLTWDNVLTTAHGHGGVSAIYTDTLGHGMFAFYHIGSDTELYFTNDYGHSWDSIKWTFGVVGAGVINGDDWFLSSYESATEKSSLYRSIAVPSGVTQTTSPAQFQILTNPASHVLELSLEEIPDEIRIVDFLSRTVGNYTTQGGAFSVDVSALPAGLYWVVTRDGAQPFVHLNE